MVRRVVASITPARHQAAGTLRRQPFGVVSDFLVRRCPVSEAQRRHECFKLFVGRFRYFNFPAIGDATTLGAADGWSEVLDTPVTHSFPSHITSGILTVMTQGKLMLSLSDVAMYP